MLTARNGSGMAIIAPSLDVLARASVVRVSSSLQQRRRDSTGATLVVRVP